MTRIALVVVNYRTAELTARAIATAGAASSSAIEVVVVDNSGDEGERKQLAELGVDRILDAPSNPGYGGGANLGVAATRGEIVLIANPDVELAPGSIDRLVESVSLRRTGLAGPSFSWDHAGEWLLPHPEVPTRHREVARILAGRSAAFGARWRRNRQRARVRAWMLRDRTDVPALSGALLCVRRDVFDAVGGFDPRFRLYFEEVDLALRIRRRGLRVVFDPGATCRHAYAQSAGRSDHAGALYLESEERFLAKWYGRRFARFAVGTRRPLRPRLEWTDAPMDRPIELPPGRWLAEASPLEDMATAAGAFVGGGPLRIPEEIRASYRGDALFVRVSDPGSGREVAAIRLVRLH